MFSYVPSERSEELGRERNVERNRLLMRCDGMGRAERDSNKDAAVVYIFIVLTVGLLAWALLAPTVTAWVRQARARQRYEPLPGGR